MPLKPPTKLPRAFNRPASIYVKNVANRYARLPDRRKQLRREQKKRIGRRWTKNMRAFLAECRLWLIIIAGVLLAGGIVTLLFSPIFDVNQIQIRRQDSRIDIEEIQRVLSPLFQERLLFVTRNQVAEMVSSRFPDIRRIDIEKRYPSILTISVFLDPLAARIEIDNDSPQTGSGMTAAGSGTYAYVTSRGHAVFSPVKLSRETLPVIHVVDWGVRPADRTLIIPPDFLQTVFEAKNVLQNDFGYPVEDIRVYVRAQEFHIRINKLSLWFDLISPLPVQFQRFREFLRTAALDQVKEYIDLRIADRVIYK